MHQPQFLSEFSLLGVGLPPLLSWLTAGRSPWNWGLPHSHLGTDNSTSVRLGLFRSELPLSFPFEVIFPIMLILSSSLNKKDQTVIYYNPSCRQPGQSAASSPKTVLLLFAVNQTERHSCFHDKRVTMFSCYLGGAENFPYRLIMHYHLLNCQGRALRLFPCK